MNLFILSLIQKEIAEFMIDKVSKILLEAVQMLCTALHTNIYKMTHKNHPVSIWCRTYQGVNILHEICVIEFNPSIKINLLIYFFIKM